MYAGRHQQLNQSFQGNDYTDKHTPAEHCPQII